MAKLMDQISNFFGGNAPDREGLQGLFVNELKGIYYTENNLVDALQEQADAATSDDVRNAFLQHKQETKAQAERLERIFDSLGIKADEMTCNAADGLIDDAQMVVSNTESGSLTRDAGLIIAGQKVEHHEIAAYGSLQTLARVLGYHQAAQLLQQSLQEEKAADQKLTQLAESFVNQQAAGETGGDNDDNDSNYAETTGDGRSSYAGTSGSERGSGYVGGTSGGATSGSSYSSGTGSTSGSSYGSGSGSTSGLTGGGYSGGTSTGGDGSTGL